MRIDAFLFLQRSDIAHYVDAKLDLGPIPHIFLDPGLIDEAVRMGLDPAHFSYRPLNTGPHFQARVMQEAEMRASMIDQLLTRERERLFDAGVYQGWDHGPLRLFFTRALVARHLGEVCDRTLKEAHIGLLRPSRPQLFYFDSFLSTDLFTGESNRWRIVDHYDKVLNWAPDHAAYCFDIEQIANMASADQAQAVTHIPTCYQNGRHFISEIERRFAHNIDLPSALWDIPVRRKTPMHKRIDSLASGAISDRAWRYRDAAHRIFEDQLGTLMPSRAGLRDQVALLTERSFMQAINFEALSLGLMGTRPHFVVTDHDTGHNGPLYSVAAKLGSPIAVLPHSSHPVFAPPHALNVTAYEQDGYHSAYRTVWGEKVALLPRRLGKPAAPIARRQARTVCLLFNTMCSQGLSYIDLAGMANFHRALARLCDNHGARLIVRLKPNGAAPLMAASAFEVPQQALQDILEVPLGQIAEASDLCISYGEPTTAGIEFLASGSYLIHSANQHWPSDFWAAPGYIADDTVPSYTDEVALEHIGALLADPAHFQRRADAQRLRFTSRLSAQDGALFQPHQL